MPAGTHFPVKGPNGVAMPRESSVQHRGMIEGVLGDEFLAACAAVERRLFARMYPLHNKGWEWGGDGWTQHRWVWSFPESHQWIYILS